MIVDCIMSTKMKKTCIASQCEAIVVCFCVIACECIG